MYEIIARKPPFVGNSISDLFRKHLTEKPSLPSAYNPDVTDVVCDDVVLMTLQYSTQWDSFAHVGSLFDADGDGTPEIVFYNGFRAKEHVKPAKKKEGVESWAQYEGAKADALGIQNLAEHGAQGRGVMIDLHAHYGRERKPIGYDDLMRVLEADKVAIEKGDMVCIYTGFADVILELAKAPDAKLLNNTGTGLDGRDAKLLQWVSDCGLAVLISDNYAVEIIPASIFSPRPHAAMPLASRPLPPPDDAHSTTPIPPLPHAIAVASTLMRPPGPDRRRHRLPASK